MEDSSCNKAALELMDSCYVWKHSMLRWDKFFCPLCMCVCILTPWELRTTMKQCVILFPLSSLSVLGFVCVCVSSPSSDPGLSRNTGPRAWRVSQPPLPCWWHPKSKTPLAEERHGPAAKILQAALSYRWGVFMFSLADTVNHKWLLQHLWMGIKQYWHPCRHVWAEDGTWSQPI